MKQPRRSKGEPVSDATTWHPENVLQESLDIGPRLPEHVVNELNNILAVILGYTELALGDVKQDSVIWKRLQHICVAGCRAKKLVQQLSNDDAPPNHK